MSIFLPVCDCTEDWIRESVFWPKDQKNGRISEKFKLSELELSSIKDKGFLKQTGGT